MLLLLCGCGGAVSTEAAPAPAAKATPSPDGCAETTAFSTDAENCGRCGHVCDDGTCTNGMCTPRVEASSALLPQTVVGDIAIAGGYVWASLADLRPNAQFAFPLVRIRDGKSATVFDNGETCLDKSTECLVTDGEVVFSAARENQKAIGRRFAPDGAPFPSVELPEGHAFQMSADKGRLAVMGSRGTLASAEPLAAASAALGLFPSAAWPVLVDAYVYVADAYLLRRVGLNGRTVCAGVTVSPDLGRNVKLTGTAVSGGFVFGVASKADKEPAVFRFSISHADIDGPEADANGPELVATLSDEARAALGTATIGVPPTSVEVVDERPVSAHGNLYFTVLVSASEPQVRARVIVEWSEARGFRPFAQMGASVGNDSAARLEVSNGRLYWVEQPTVAGVAVPRWSIASLPL